MAYSSVRPRWARLLNYFFVLLFTISGIAAGSYGVLLALRGSASTDWPSTTGMVTSTEIRRGVFRYGVVEYKADIRYEYEVAGQRYTGDTIRIGDPWKPERSHAERDIRNYSGLVIVYYDPSDPGASVLDPGVHLEAWICITGGIFFLAIAVAGMIIERRKKVEDADITRWLDRRKFFGSHHRQGARSPGSQASR